MPPPLVILPIVIKPEFQSDFRDTYIIVDSVGTSHIEGRVVNMACCIEPPSEIEALDMDRYIQRRDDTVLNFQSEEILKFYQKWDGCQNIKYDDKWHHHCRDEDADHLSSILKTIRKEGFRILHRDPITLDPLP